MNIDEAKSLLSRLLHRIAPEVDLTDADPDALLQDEFDLDSMDFLNFMVGLHQGTGIDVPESDYARLSTLDACVEYLNAAGGAGERPA